MADGRKHWYLCSGGGGIWDYAAPVLLLKESGCVVTDLKGKPWKAGTGPFIAANPKLHKELISITQKL
jgi:myo-inositol-1(or 4)-monophosphatase